LHLRPIHTNLPGSQFSRFKRIKPYHSHGLAIRSV
jgi:hypothetical protein